MMSQTKIFRAWDGNAGQWMCTTVAAYKWYSEDKSHSYKKESSNARFLSALSEVTEEDKDCAVVVIDTGDRLEEV